MRRKGIVPLRGGARRLPRQRGCITFGGPAGAEGESSSVWDPCQGLNFHTRERGRVQGVGGGGVMRIDDREGEGMGGGGVAVRGERKSRSEGGRGVR